MKIKFLVLLIILLTNSNLKSQNNDFQAASYNVGLGALFGVVGSVINKKSNEPLGKVILKGLGQGALGGYVTFESKRLLREVDDMNDWKIFWGSKLVNAAGTSIVQNAALNKNFWEQWNLNIGFNRIEFHTKDKFSLKYKVMPIAFVSTTYSFISFKFDASKSFKTGEFIFKTEKEFENTNSIGVYYPGFIMYDEKYFNNPYLPKSGLVNTIKHEIIHSYQSNDFMVLNTYLDKPLNYFSNKNKTVKTLNKHIYLEFHYLPLRALYLYETNSAKNYYDNFFEHEAGYYPDTLPK